jgi:hypothetical protein
MERGVIPVIPARPVPSQALMQAIPETERAAGPPELRPVVHRPWSAEAHRALRARAAEQVAPEQVALAGSPVRALPVLLLRDGVAQVRRPRVQEAATLEVAGAMPAAAWVVAEERAARLA